MSTSQDHGNGAGAGDWAAVGTVVRERMRELGMSTAELAREAGLSETTIRYLGQSREANWHRRSTLVVMSAVLRWRYDHLANVLHGEPYRNTTGVSRDIHLQRLLDAELNALKEETAALRRTAQGMRRKIDMLPVAPGTAGEVVWQGSQR